MKIAGLTLAAKAIPSMRGEVTSERPNVIVVIADQRHYGLSKATGYALDTSPALDRL
jgi:arylsulfatase A-like enzyme